MPGATRWNLLSHSWAAGILSPTEQDKPDTAQAIQGAADLENFEVERDGGLTGRPPFVRSEHSFALPRWSAVDLASPGLARPVRIGFDGEHALNPSRPVPGTAVSQGMVLYECRTDPAPLVRSVTFHGTRLVVGEWGNDQDEPYLGVQYLPAGETVWRDAEIPIAQLPDATRASPRFLQWGVFAPGRVARDIVVPLTAPDFEAGIQVQGVRIVVSREIPDTAAAAIPKVHLLVRGISVPTETDTGRRIWYTELDRVPLRVIPWVVGPVPLVLVLTPNGAQAFHIADNTVRTPPGADFTAVWYFSPKQLRELTWTAYGKSLLLAHRDFVYPVRVGLAAGANLFVQSLVLQNLPEVDVDAVPDSGVDITEYVTVQLPPELFADATGGA